MSAAETSGASLVRRFGAVLDTGRIEDLDQILAPACNDANPIPLQPAGRDGVALKIALYRAQEPASRSRFVTIDEGDDAIVAEWITEIPSCDPSRWRGRFTIEAARIAAFQVTRVG